MSFNDRLTYLGEILVALASSPLPSQQFQVLADEASGAVPCDYLAVCLVDPDRNGYLVHSLSGLAAGAIPSRSFHLQEGMAGHVICTNRTYVTTDLTSFPEGSDDLEGLCGRLGLRAALVIPLRQEEKALGALLFAAKPPTRYDENDVQIGQLLAAGVSASLETARLYQALADERSTLAAVLSSSQDAILMINEQGMIMLANPAARAMLGLDERNNAGRPLSEVVSDPALQKLFAEQQPGLAEIKLSGGRTAQANLVSVTSDYGEPIGWAAVFRDITLYKELEQMKNDFVNTVSHDLKNPISSITLAADFLDKAGELSEEQLKIRDGIAQTAAYMNELVSDLLDLGKIEAGLDMVVEPFNLAALIREAVTTLRTGAEKKEQELAMTVPDEIEIEGDQRRLKQVLLNIIGNAVKYTPLGGKVQVVATVANSSVVVEVMDGGIGIPAKDLPYIFDKFYRVNSKETRHIKGTGLGLAIAKSVVEAHDGRIWAESVEGEGSTFSFSLPV